MVTYWVVGLAYLVPDLAHLPPAVVKTKHQRTREYRAGGTPFAPPLRKVVANALMNQIFVLLPGLILLHEVSTRFEWSIIVPRSLPTLQDVLLKSVAALLGVEIGFYYSHRLLHWKPLYRFHKVHHAFATPIALSAIYSHPLEAFLSSTVAIIGVGFFVRMHLLHFLASIVVGWGRTCHGHSGYAFPTGDGFHDRHHSINTGNYGVLTILDWLHGTTIIVKKKNKYSTRVLTSQSV